MVYFIKPSDIITRLRSTIAQAESNLTLPEGFVSYSNRVAGSAYVSGLTETNIQQMQTPCCFVTLANGYTISNSMENLDQNIINGFDVILVLDTVDPRKQTAEEISIGFRNIITYCLNGWKVPNYPAASPLRLVSDSTVYADKSKYVRVMTFMYDVKFIASEDLLKDETDFNMANFERFFADLLIGETEREVGLQVTDMYDEE
jgi:hypothetical protein